MTSGKHISIWFFIGTLLLIYGVLILFSGFAETSATPVVLAEYHAAIWWGALLLALGLVYTIKFFPKR